MRLVSLVMVMFTFVSVLAQIAPGRTSVKPPQTVQAVDLDREFARPPAKGCDPGRLELTMPTDDGALR